MRRLSFPSCEAIFHNFLGEESMLWRFLETSLEPFQGLKKHTVGTFSIHAVLFPSSVVDPDPYWECRSGSRSIEIDQINLVSCLS
jgi:hypothetical protein